MKMTKVIEKSCPICEKEVLRIEDYRNGYCKSCRAKYNKDYYIDKVANKRFIYFLKGKDDKCLYVGSTKGKYRAIYHLKGLSHLELYTNDWVQLGLNKLVYADVTEITRDDKERYFLEKMYIQMYQPILNSDNEPDPSLETDRIESFVDLIYNQYIEFREIDIKKTSHEGKAFFNYNDLVLR